MANNQSIEVFGAKELAKTFGDLSKNFTGEMTPALKKAEAVIVSEAVRLAPHEDGYLRANIKSKIFVSPDAITVRVGILDTTAVDETGRQVAKYGGVQNAKHQFLNRAIFQRKDMAIAEMIKGSQKILNNFFTAGGNPGKI